MEIRQSGLTRGMVTEKVVAISNDEIVDVLFDYPGTIYAIVSGVGREAFFFVTLGHGIAGWLIVFYDQNARRSLLRRDDDQFKHRLAAVAKW